MMTRGITDISYHAPGLPAWMQTESGDRLETLYTASGRKVAETTMTNGVRRTRYYAGPWEIEDGNITRVSVDGGYIDTDNVLHNYVPDIRGSVLGVMRHDAAGSTLEQYNEYYAHGALTADS